tara:strand:+ start:663 stop:1148 length:486 start_codon:yes stop_codon:yes gene_type:complete
MDLKIDITPPSDNSIDDDNRKELPWQSREEKLLDKWMVEMYNISSKHNIAGKKYKKLFAICSIPSTLIPLVLSSLSVQLEEYPLIQSILMILTGSLIGISTFFNLGSRFTKHFEYENRYEEIAREIEKELGKPKRYRYACDVYMEKIYMSYCGLNARSPNV